MRMTLVQVKIPETMLAKISIVSEVDGENRSTVIRDAIKEYLESLDWDYYLENSSDAEDESSSEDDDELVCPECEKPIDEDDEECPHCGEDLEDDDDTVADSEDPKEA